MPRVKSSDTAPKKAPVRKKTLTKTIHPKKKTKSILVDVIEDEALPSEKKLASDFPVESENKKKRKGMTSQAEKTTSEISSNLDRQKEFFSSLALKEKSTDNSNDGRGGKQDREAGKRSLGLYRRLAIKFIILVVALAVIVAYFSFSKLTVAVNLKGETISDTLLLKIFDPNNTEVPTVDDATDSITKTATATVSMLQNDPREPMAGNIKEIGTSIDKTYLATGETYLGEEVVGSVRIINNYNKSQPLVATTRLLSPDGKLFRIKNAVNVPAGGEVTVDIYTDKPAENMAISSTTFTIPGLWLGLQDKIYAKNDAPFTFTKKVQKYVTANDLEMAVKDIGENLIDNAKSKAGAGQNWLYLTLTSPVVNIDAKVGAKQEEFTAKASGKIVAVAVDVSEMSKLAAAKLNLIIPDDKELANFKGDNISYSLDNYDVASKTATVKASFSGTMILRSDAQVINPQQLVGLTDEQIRTYLNSRPELKEYTLKFSPAFMKKAPSLVDRIKIEVDKN